MVGSASFCPGVAFARPLCVAEKRDPPDAPSRGQTARVVQPAQRGVPSDGRFDIYAQAARSGGAEPGDYRSPWVMEDILVARPRVTHSRGVHPANGLRTPPSGLWGPAQDKPNGDAA